MSHLTTDHQRAAGRRRAYSLKKYDREYPDRAHYDLRIAARRLNLRIRGCEAQMYNSNAKGRRGNLDGGDQWLDLVCSHPTLGVLVIDLIDPDPRYGPRFTAEKAAELERRRIHYLTLHPAPMTKMQVEIAVWIRKIEKGIHGYNNKENS